MDEDDYYHEIEIADETEVSEVLSDEFIDIVRYLEENLSAIDEETDEYDVRSILGEGLEALHFCFEEKESSLNKHVETNYEEIVDSHDDLIEKLLEFKNDIDMEIDVSKSEIIYILQDWIDNYTKISNN